MKVPSPESMAANKKAAHAASVVVAEKATLETMPEGPNKEYEKGRLVAYEAKAAELAAVAAELADAPECTKRNVILLCLF